MKQNVIWHKQNGLADNEKRVVSEIRKETGFKIQKEIFRGKYYHKGKTLTATIIYKGGYNGVPATLKIQGLRLEAAETQMIRSFERQNKSRIIHAPKIYLSRAWSRKRGYGFLISEYVDAPTICDRPFATDKQMTEFARFYQEYRTRAITKPWMKPDPGSVYVGNKVDTEKALVATINTVERWRRNAEAEGRLKLEDYAPYVLRFYPLAARYIPGMQLAFMHRELTAQHILKLTDGTYRIFANLLWGYRLEWSDLSYNLWRSILDIRNNSYSFNKLLAYVNKWLRVYKTIPAVKKDKEFDRKIRFLLLERALGIIVGDLGFGEYWGSRKGKRYFKHMLQLNQRLFEHFASELEK